MKLHSISKEAPNSHPENRISQPAGQNHLLAVAILAATAIATTVVAGYGAALAPVSTAPAAMSVNSAVTVSEDADHYLVTLSLPGSQSPQVDIRMKGSRLQIASGRRSGGTRFEQSLLLPQADPLLNPSVERSSDQILISVPKTAGLARTSTMPSTSGGTAPAPAIDPQDQDISRQFARMQQQMDAMMKQAFQGFGQGGALPGGGLANASAGSLTVNIENKPDAYIVHAQVPDQEMKNIQVSVNNDRVLNITTRHSSSTGGVGTSSMSTQTSNFSQMLTLPGPVQSKDMKVDQRDGELQITLPKA